MSEAHLSFNFFGAFCATSSVVDSYCIQYSACQACRFFTDCFKLAAILHHGSEFISWKLILHSQTSNLLSFFVQIWSNTQKSKNHFPTDAKVMERSSFFSLSLHKILSLMHRCNLFPIKQLKSKGNEKHAKAKFPFVATVSCYVLCDKLRNSRQTVATHWTLPLLETLSHAAQYERNKNVLNVRSRNFVHTFVFLCFFFLCSTFFH